MVFSQVISALGAENHHDFTAIVDANHAMRQISKAEQVRRYSHSVVVFIIGAIFEVIVVVVACHRQSHCQYRDLALRKQLLLGSFFGLTSLAFANKEKILHSLQGFPTSSISALFQKTDRRSIGPD